MALPDTTPVGAFTNQTIASINESLIVQSAQIELSAAEVNALSSSSVVVVKGVPGKTIVILQINIRYNFGGEAFTVADDTSEFAFSEGPDSDFSAQIMQDFCDQSSSQVCLDVATANIIGPLSTIRDQPVTVNNPGTASSGGLNSTVTINVLYSLF